MDESVKDIACGSVAGILGKFVEYPFDTVKVRMQSQPSHLPRLYAGPLDCFRQSISHDGFGSLYRGISAPLISAAVENSSLFFSYQITQQALSASGVYARGAVADRLPVPALVLCGAASGAFTSLLLTPVELVKCKMQVSSRALHSATIPSLIRQIYHQHGLLGFWHGQLGTLIRETGGGAAWFGTYEYTTLLFRRLNSTGSLKHSSEGTELTLAMNRPISLPQQLLAGACAGMSYNFLFYPADTIKSRMQTESLHLAPQRPLMPSFRGAASTTASNSPEFTPILRRTFGTEISLLWRQQGLAGFYRGCGITVLRSAPSSALIFAVYEWLRSHFPHIERQETTLVYLNDD